MSVDFTICFLRKEQELSQRQLADRSGLLLKSIQEFEKGTRLPDEKYIVKLAFAFGVSTACFADYKSDRERSEQLRKLPVGKRIQTLRIWSRIYLWELSDKTGIRESTIRSYEGLSKTPPIEDLRKLSAMLETGFDLLADLDYESDEIATTQGKKLLSYYNTMDSSHKQMLVEIAKSFSKERW